MNKVMMRTLGFEFDEEQGVWWRDIMDSDVRITFQNTPTLDELWSTVEQAIINEVFSWKTN